MGDLPDKERLVPSIDTLLKYMRGETLGPYHYYEAVEAIESLLTERNRQKLTIEELDKITRNAIAEQGRAELALTDTLFELELLQWGGRGECYDCGVKEEEHADHAKDCRLGAVIQRARGIVAKPEENANERAY